MKIGILREKNKGSKSNSSVVLTFFELKDLCRFIQNTRGIVTKYDGCSSEQLRLGKHLITCTINFIEFLICIRIQVLLVAWHRGYVQCA